MAGMRGHELGTRTGRDCRAHPVTIAVNLDWPCCVGNETPLDAYGRARPRHPLEARPECYEERLLDNTSLTGGPRTPD